MRTHFNDIITGNAGLLCCEDRYGGIQRIFWPQPDFAQIFNAFVLGIWDKSIGEYTFWFDDRKNLFRQQYEENSVTVSTNIEIGNTGLSIALRDCAMYDDDILIRRIAIKNNTGRDISPKLVCHSNMSSQSGEACGVVADVSANGYLHHRATGCVGVMSFARMYAYQMSDDSFGCACRGELFGKDDISMAADISAMWSIGEICAGDEAEIKLILCFGKSFGGVRRIMHSFTDQCAEKLWEKTQQSWCELLLRQDSQGGKRFERAEIGELYKSSARVFALLRNKYTGGIIAAPENDEERKQSGGYGYCWCRDGAFVTVAMDAIGMYDEVEHFFRWAASVQEPDGSWLQRYYTGGNPAPSWGMQADETASVIFGIYKHYEVSGNGAFLSEMSECVKNAADFLAGFSAPSGMPGELVGICYDIWEERSGIHLYTSAAIIAALEKACIIAGILGSEAAAFDTKRWKHRADEIRSGLDKYFLRPDGKYCRSYIYKKNPWGSDGGSDTVECEVSPLGYRRDFSGYSTVPDISLLGLWYPFDIYGENVEHDERQRQMTDYLQQTLEKQHEGAIMRYAEDSYIGGNPWIIASAWLGICQARQGDRASAEKKLNWILRCITESGFLPEQAEPSGDTKWVLPLAWSHAMAVLLANELYGKGV